MNLRYHLSYDTKKPNLLSQMRKFSNLSLQECSWDLKRVSNAFRVKTTKAKFCVCNWGKSKENRVGKDRNKHSNVQSLKNVIIRTQWFNFLVFFRYKNCYRVRLWWIWCRTSPAMFNWTVLCSVICDIKLDFLVTWKNISLIHKWCLPISKLLSHVQDMKLISVSLF